MKIFLIVLMTLTGYGYGQCESVDNFNPPANTGSNMTLGFLLNSWPDDIDVSGSSLISAQVQINDNFYIAGWSNVDNYNDFFALAVWGDDSTTPELDGASTGQEVNLYLHLENSCYQIITSQPIEYMINDIQVINSVTFVLLEINESPTAQDATYTLNEDSSILLGLEAYDSYGNALISSPSGNAIFSIVEEPASGHVLILQGGANYVPNANFNGIDSFQFQVNDGQFDSNIATVTMIVNAVNDAPFLYPIENVSIEQGSTLSYSLQAEDLDGDFLVYTVAVTGGNATSSIYENVLTIIPHESNVDLEVAVTVSDGAAIDSTSFILTVTSLEDSCNEEYSQGFNDGAASGDVNNDGMLNITDIVLSISMILGSENSLLALSVLPLAFSWASKS